MSWLSLVPFYLVCLLISATYFYLTPLSTNSLLELFDFLTFYQFVQSHLKNLL